MNVFLPQPCLEADCGHGSPLDRRERRANTMKTVWPGSARSEISRQRKPAALEQWSGGTKMKNTMVLSILGAAAILSASSVPADAVVYCKYIGVPKGCVARPGVVLVAAPGVGAPGVGVRRGTPMNRGGPVNRVGRR
jgi:hypothetical protein